MRLLNIKSNILISFIKDFHFINVNSIVNKYFNLYHLDVLYNLKSICYQYKEKHYYYNSDTNNILRSLSYKKKLKNRPNTLKLKVCNILHKYTGYSNINIYGNNTRKYPYYMTGRLYNYFFQYLNFSIKLFLSNNMFVVKKLQEIWLKKNLYTSEDFLDLSYHAIRYLDIKTKIKEFLFKFPFYSVRKFKKFLIKLFFYLTYPNQKIQNIFLILKNSFYYIYKRHDSHFIKAFKFYQALINKLYSSGVLNVHGIKIICKGRFGKVRKQIKQFTFGYLKLNTVIQPITYYNSLMITPRGSYGFHMWFASIEDK
jgi:hypothetical protein